MSESEEAFFKQRRNLIAVSLIVTFMNLAAADLSKLNIFGNEITFSNPKAIPISLAVALIYFVIRYLQYMHDVEDKGFKSRFFAKTKTYLGPYLIKREFNREDSKLPRDYAPLSDLKVYTLNLFIEGRPYNTVDLNIVHKRGGVVIQTPRFELSPVEFALPMLRSIIYITFRTRLATDYVLPMFLAFFAFASYHPLARELSSQWL